MKKIKASFLISLFLIFSFLVSACAERDGTVNCFPNQVINAQILLNGYPKLLTQQWDYTKGETGTGNRGLIIFFNGSSYAIYDRNAPKKEQVFTLVPDNESDLKLGKISVNTPIAKDLLGKAVGETADITLPNGNQLSFEVLEITL